MDGYLKDTNSGKITEIVYGWKGAPAPSGKSFVEHPSPGGLEIGAQAPASFIAALSATDAEMARGAEDTIAALIQRGILTHADYDSALISKINARRALRGQAAI